MTTLKRDPQQPGTMTGSPERAAQQVAAPALVYDLAGELDQLHQERGWQHSDRISKTLVKEADFRVVLAALHAGARIERHTAPGRLSIQVVRGRVRVQLAERALELGAAGLLALERDVAHDVEALEDSAILLTIA